VLLIASSLANQRQCFAIQTTARLSVVVCLLSGLGPVLKFVNNTTVLVLTCVCARASRDETSVCLSALTSFSVLTNFYYSVAATLSLYQFLFALTSFSKFLPASPSPYQFPSAVLYVGVCRML
jgi:hypothetical protein